MMQKIFIASVVVLTCISQFSFAACDVAALETEVDTWRKQLKVELGQRMATDLYVNPDLNAYADKVGELKACRASLGMNPIRCNYLNVFTETELTPYIRFQRTFELREDSARGCRPSSELIYFLRALNGTQLLNYYAGYYSFSVSPICTAKDGMQMTRGMMVTDGPLTGASQFFILDYGIPFNNFRSSQFWALAVPVGNNERVSWRVASGNQIEFNFTNGAQVVLDGKKGFISSINFLSLQSVITGCSTDNNAKTGLNRNYWPIVDVLEGTGYVSGPSIIVKN